MTPAMEVSVMDNNKVVMKLNGSITKDRLKEFEDGVKLAAKTVQETSQQSGKVKILFDLSHFDGTYDSDAMSQLAWLAKTDEPFTERTACFGGPLLTRMLVELVSGLSGRENIRYFASRDAALEWLG